MVPSSARNKRERRVPTESQALGLSARAGRHHVADHETGRAHQHRLGEGDHAAVGREEDHAGGGDAHDQRLREDDVDPVRVEDRRPGEGDQECDGCDRALCQHLRVVRHENLPNSPCGRNARTSASNTNVKTIEYWVQQLFPAVGRYTAEKENTSP